MSLPTLSQKNGFKFNLRKYLLPYSTPPAVFIPDDRAFLKAAYTLLEPFFHVLLCMKIYRKSDNTKMDNIDL